MTLNMGPGVSVSILQDSSRDGAVIVRTVWKM